MRSRDRSTDEGETEERLREAGEEHYQRGKVIARRVDRVEKLFVQK
jgi:hypothetical protein